MGSIVPYVSVFRYDEDSYYKYPYEMHDDYYTEKEEEKLDALCKYLRKHVREDRDAVICVTGGEGVGKSNLALKLAQKLDDNFTIIRNMLLNPKAADFYEKLVNELPKYSVIVLDEGMQMFYKRGWQGKERLFL